MKENKEEIFLWDGMRSGNEKHLHSLYLLYYNDLLRYGMSLTSNPGLSKEFINNLFFNFWDNRRKLPEVKSPKAYIISSYKNSILFTKKDKWDLKIIFPDSNGFLFEHQSTASSEETIVELEQYDELKSKLKAVLSKLSDRQRELILARFIDELSYEEISIKLGISVRTVYNSIHESLKTLRKHISKEDFFENPEGSKATKKRNFNFIFFF